MDFNNINSMNEEERNALHRQISKEILKKLLVFSALKAAVVIVPIVVARRMQKNDLTD